jgi:hypothetical protein
MTAVWKYPGPRTKRMEMLERPMKSLIPWISVFLLGGSAVAQDMEPSLNRAAGNLAARLSQFLPGVDPAPSALALVADRDTEPAVVGALAKALTEDGYRVVFGRHAAADDHVLTIKVSSGSSETPGRITLDIESGQGRRMVCLYGDATWLEDTPRGAIQVEGPFRASRDAAVEAAYEQAWARFRARHPEAATGDSSRPMLHSAARRLIVTFASAPAGQRVYRAHLQVMPDKSFVRALERKATRLHTKRLWQPWKLAAGLLALAFVLGFAYVGTDLKTRGYMTGTLRVLFGILFLIGVFFCWRVIL